MSRFLIIIIHNLLNDKKLVEKLAASYPIRRAAQLLVYFYEKNKPAIDFKRYAELDGDKLVQKLKQLKEELKKK